MSLLGQFHVPMFSWLRYHYRANISALPSPLSTLSLSLPHSWLTLAEYCHTWIASKCTLHIGPKWPTSHKTEISWSTVSWKITNYILYTAVRVCYNWLTSPPLSVSSGDCHNFSHPPALSHPHHSITHIGPSLSFRPHSAIKLITPRHKYIGFMQSEINEMRR